MIICKSCGCTAQQAAADALVLGFQEEFMAGMYSCCQMVAWADEQWLAWAEAAAEDGKCEEAVTKVLEVGDDHCLLPVRLRFPDTQR